MRLLKLGLRGSLSSIYGESESRGDLLFDWALVSELNVSAVTVQGLVSEVQALQQDLSREGLLALNRSGMWT